MTEPAVVEVQDRISRKDIPGAFCVNGHSVGIWSTEYTMTTGQAIVTCRVANEILPVLGGTCNYVFPVGSGWAALLGWLKSTRRLWDDLLRRKLRLLYLVCSRSNSGFLRDVPALLSARFGARVIVHVHGSDIEDLLTRRLFSPIARWLYRKVTLIVPSEHLLAPLQRAGIYDLRVCENFYDSQVRPISYSRDKGSFRVLWNSNIMASKGFFTLYRACEAIRAVNIPVELTVLGAPMGDAEMSQTMVEQKMEKCSAAEFVHFVGHVTPEQANNWLSCSDVVALPSRYSSECQPLSLIAAMCAGIPIVVGELPALRSTVEEYPAEFVEAHSAEAVAEALQRIYISFQCDVSDDNVRRRRAAECACKRFSVERFDREMIEILRI